MFNGLWAQRIGFGYNGYIFSFQKDVMPRKTAKASNKEKPKVKVDIHFIKTNGYRNIFINGVYGGASPANRMIYMSVFTDRPPIPQMTSNTLEGKILREIQEERVTKNGLIRDVEAGIIMDLPTAKLIANWLQEKIKSLEESP